MIPNICSPISCQTIELAKATYEHLIELDLADGCNETSNLDVDVLIGGDYYWRFMTGKMIRGDDGPVALHTILGWVLSGLIDGSNSLTTSTLMTNHVLKIDYCPAPNDELTERDKMVISKVKKFWNIEDVSEASTIKKHFGRF